MQLSKQILKPKGYTKTQKVLHGMFVENTGMAMMDSGGDNGRNWQRNQGVDFRKMPRVDYEYDGQYTTVTRSLFHHLDDCCEFDPIENKKFANYCKRRDMPSNTNSVEEYLYEKDIVDQGDIYKYHTDNTYNNENIMSQVMQYVAAGAIDKVYISIHGGADVRGGYTDIKVFDFDTDMFFMMTDCRLGCKCGEVYSDDCAQHWYDNWFGKDGIPSCWSKHMFRDKYQCKVCREIVWAC